jgi:hypothetical protein
MRKSVIKNVQKESSQEIDIEMKEIARKMIFTPDKEEFLKLQDRLHYRRLDYYMAKYVESF